MSNHRLSALPIDPDLARRLATEASRRGCAPAELVRGTLAELLERLEADVVQHQPSRFCFCGGPGCSWHRVEVEILPDKTMVALADSVAVRVDEPRVSDPRDAWREWFAESVDAAEVERQLVADGRMPPRCACASDVECSCGGAR